MCLENDDLRVFKDLPEPETEMFMEEYEKCLESPAYFYNNYVLIKSTDGNWIKPNPVTDEEIETAIQKHRENKRKRENMACLRNIKNLMRMFPKEFQDKQIFITPEMREEFKKL